MRAMNLFRTLFILLLWVIGPASQSVAAGEMRDYNVPASSLETALNAFGRQAGILLSFDSALVSGLDSPGINGQHDVVQGLNRLAGPAGLQVVPMTAGGYRLVAADEVAVEDSGEAPEMLPPLTVEGVSESARFWLSDLPEAYEGGQVGSGARAGLLGNLDVFDTPFSVTSYTSELIENQQARTVGDVIRNDASALSTDSAGQSIREGIGIRGFRTDYNLYDGLPNLHFIYGSSTVQTLERVEVFKGPNALLNGAAGWGYVGGAINLVPKRPTDTALTRLTADYDYQSRLGAHADLSRRFGSEKQFGARLNAIYRNGEGAREGIGETFGEAALALEYRGDRLKLETILDYRDRELRRGDNFFFILSGNATAAPSVPDLENTIQQPWAKNEIKAARGLLRAEYALGRDWAAHAAYGALAAEEYRLQSFNRNFGANGDFNPLFIFERYKNNNYAWNAGIRGGFETAGVTHQVSIETMQTKQLETLPKNYRELSLNITSNLYKPVFVARPAFDDSIGGWAKRYELLDSSIAIADTLGFLDERVLLTAGIRRQSIEYKGFNFNTGAVRSRYDKSAITPAIGLLVKPWDFMSLYSNYIEALERGPTAPRGTVNEGEIFPPSVTDQIEFGVKFDLDGLGLTAGLFQIERPNGITDATTNRFSVDGELRNRGLELNAFGELRPNLRLLGGITYLDSKLTRTQGGRFDGNDTPGVPELAAVLNLEYDTAAFPGLTLTARAEHVGSRFIRNDNSLKIPSYELYGIGARYQRTLGDKAFTLRMNIDNLLNEGYWNTIPGRDGWLYLGAPRGINLSFSVAF